MLLQKPTWHGRLGRLWSQFLPGCNWCSSRKNVQKCISTFLNVLSYPGLVSSSPTSENVVFAASLVSSSTFDHLRKRRLALLASRCKLSPCKCREAASVSRNKHNQNTKIYYLYICSTHRNPQKKETTHPCMRRTSKAHYPQCKIFNVERRISLSVSPSQG